MSTHDRLVLLAMFCALGAVALFVPKGASFALGTVAGYLVIRFFDLPRFFDRGGRGREGRRSPSARPRPLVPAPATAATPEDEPGQFFSELDVLGAIERRGYSHADAVRALRSAGPGAEWDFELLYRRAIQHLKPGFSPRREARA